MTNVPIIITLNPSLLHYNGIFALMMIHAFCYSFIRENDKITGIFRIKKVIQIFSFKVINK